MAENLKFRNPELAQNIAAKIKNLAPKAGKIKICHVCGTHEWTITHFGLRSLLPENVEVIAGPGCPVCIVPAAEIDEAVQLAQNGHCGNMFWRCVACARQQNVAFRS